MTLIKICCYNYLISLSKLPLNKKIIISFGLLTIFFSTLIQLSLDKVSQKGFGKSNPEKTYTETNKATSPRIEKQKNQKESENENASLIVLDKDFYKKFTPAGNVYPCASNISEFIANNVERPSQVILAVEQPLYFLLLHKNESHQYVFNCKKIKSINIIEYLESNKKYLVGQISVNSGTEFHHILSFLLNETLILKPSHIGMSPLGEITDLKVDNTEEYSILIATYEFASLCDTAECQPSSGHIMYEFTLDKNTGSLYAELKDPILE